MSTTKKLDAERQRLQNARDGKEDWSLWGPYLAERAWGTVREDYSDEGEAWGYFSHDQACSRAYRWNEDGMAGLCDQQQILCLSLALWNGQDRILKERAFGLTGDQGNRGEDVKEYYFYDDALPSHAYLKYIYKYPQSAYPYEQLVTENAERDRTDPPFNLLDTGVLDNDRYWDIEVEYAKQSEDIIHMQITAYNRGPDEAVLHLLPQLWFRNTWSWGDEVERPQLTQLESEAGNEGWSIKATHSDLGDYYWYGSQSAELLFCENETNTQLLWDTPNSSDYVKDGFHRRVVEADEAAVNPEKTGSKCAAWYSLTVASGESAQVTLVLSAQQLAQPFQQQSEIVTQRKAETEQFYHLLLPEASTEDHRILRKALSGMIWTKQFFQYDVDRWLKGDQESPADERLQGRNKSWRHFNAHDVISMPDCWEYPWFAAWDLAYHCAPLALIDYDFAKQQIELMLNERYLHPNGQIPAYEWAFEDVNPPVHAFGTLKVFRAERMQRGQGDVSFLQRVFHKLLLNYAWWINRKDSEGHNVFEGGFLGLDNISVYNRSKSLPEGFSLKQADATGWMAMFAVNMTVMALEIATENADYEGIAIQCYQQFVTIAETMAGQGEGGIDLWDEEAGFFKDAVTTDDGEQHLIDVYSWVGLIPLFACEIIDQRLLHNVPRFKALLLANKEGRVHGKQVFADPVWENENGEHLLGLVDHHRLSRILERLLDEDQFLSRYGVRSLSKIHDGHRDLGMIPGVGNAVIEYVPGESNSPMFGGNSNWRGPVWMPTNYSLVHALEKYYRYLGDDFTVPVACENNQPMNLKQIATLISERLVDLYRRDEQGIVPALRRDSPFQSDPHWQDLCFFYEYFHAETGQGLGAAHQTGWTGLIANLIMRRYDRHITAYWEED